MWNIQIKLGLSEEFIVSECNLTISQKKIWRKTFDCASLEETLRWELFEVTIQFMLPLMTYFPSSFSKFASRYRFTWLSALLPFCGFHLLSFRFTPSLSQTFSHGYLLYNLSLYSSDLLVALCYFASTCGSNWERNLSHWIFNIELGA